MSFIIKGQEDAYQSLLTALGQRDLYTKGHCERVHKLALHMGIALGLPAADLETLHIASILHDIGKVGIPDAILLKPGRLSGVEWEKMQAHSIYGEQIISNTLFPNREGVASVVRHHHESFDGSGYPDGLTGKDIPLNCRILLIIDSYDAITTTRAYRKARTHSDAMEILSTESGSKLDPDMFAVFSKTVALHSVQPS